VTYIFDVFHAAERRIDSAFADLVPQESLILIFAQFTAGKAQSAPENGTERLKVSQHPPLNTMNLMGRPCWILGPPQSAGRDRRFKPQYRCGELLWRGCSRSRRRSPRQWRHFDRYRDHAIVFRQEKYSRETGGPSRALELASLSSECKRAGSECETVAIWRTFRAVVHHPHLRYRIEVGISPRSGGNPGVNPGSR